mgnify:CR=1 FL=1
MTDKILPTTAEINAEMRANTLKLLRDPNTNATAHAALMKRYADLEQAALDTGIGKLSRAVIQRELTEAANRLGRKLLE